MPLPAHLQPLADHVAAQLAAVPGMAAVALGGSWAAGAARPDSDLDFGLYYDEAAPFDPDALRPLAAALTRPGAPPPTVTAFYGWGPWVNGGAWIHSAEIPAQSSPAPRKIDFIYRNLRQVEQTIAEAQAGVVRHDWNQQPTFGFTSIIYLAECAILEALHDPAGRLARLKAAVADYPPALQAAVVQHSLWGAEFALIHARGHAARGDVYNTAGCLTRVASNLAQALFALNRRYFLGDKHAPAAIDSFALAPPAYGARLAAILAAPGAAPAALAAAVAALHDLWAEVVALAPAYRPAFEL